MGLAACSSTNAALSLASPIAGSNGAIREGAGSQGRYGALREEKFPVQAINLSRINEQYLRQFIHFETREQPGTIIILIITGLLMRRGSNSTD